MLRRIFISTIKNTSCVAPLLLLSETHPSDVSRGPFQASHRLRRRFFFQNNRHRALTPLLLLSKLNPLTLGFNFVFIPPGYLSCQSLPRHCGRHIVRSSFQLQNHGFEADFCASANFVSLAMAFFFSAGAQPRGARKGRGRLVSVPAFAVCRHWSRVFSLSAELLGLLRLK